jgi:hypothetical protein
MPPRKAKPDFMQPAEPATGTYNGEPFVLSPREVYAADHELVRAYPHLFKPFEPNRQRPTVEQMTAAPGEKR